MDTFETQGIIFPLTEPTAWAKSIVYMTKADGSIKLYLDPRVRNKTFEDIIAQLYGAGYRHLNLDQESRKLTTFITLHGRCMFNRFSMGIKYVQNEFQRVMEENVSDLKMSFLYVMIS